MLQPKIYVKDKNKVYDIQVIDYKHKIVIFFDNETQCTYTRLFDEVRFFKNTGYKDKNGNCICEYDIVKYHDDGKDEDLKGGIFVVVKEQCGTSYYLEDNGFCMISLRNSNQDITVIGNIYENKELVENE